MSTAITDLRGVLRLRFATAVPRFLAIGALSTLAYGLLYLLLRGGSPEHEPAEEVAS